MARSAVVDIEEIGPVLLERSRRSKHVNIFVRPFKGVRVAVPRGVSFEEAEKIARTEIGWMKKHLAGMRKLEQEYVFASGARADIDFAAAKKTITDRVNELAGRHRFTFNKLSVRDKKTQWGSCSPRNNISLNIKLVLLPQELIDYVILHELVHTRVKNHKKTFWSDLDGLVGDAKGLDSRLRSYHLELM